jgi:hypothetical protein
MAVVNYLDTRTIYESPEARVEKHGLLKALMAQFEWL